MISGIKNAKYAIFCYFRANIMLSYSFIFNRLYAIQQHPFGMMMLGRSFSSGSYRYGFNKGSEKNNEIAGEGNHYTTFFRELDTRLGRWWSQDPILIPEFSPYVSMNNNPIFVNDKLGDIWDVSTDDNTQEDVSSIVKQKNRKYLNIGENGRVTLDFRGLTVENISKKLNNDNGLLLVYLLTTAKDDKGEDIKFYYSNYLGGISDEETGKILNDEIFDYRNGEELVKIDTKKGVYETLKPYIFNASVEPYGNNQQGKTPPQLLPREGYNGEVVILPGMAQFISYYKDDNGNLKSNTIIVRAELIMHELMENLIRTVYKIPYLEAHPKTNLNGYNVSLNKFIYLTDE
jgi:RHS repeat-associated protein